MQSSLRTLLSPTNLDPHDPQQLQVEAGQTYEERPPWRFWVLGSAFLLLGLIVLAQLVRYQVFRSERDLPGFVPPQEQSARGAIVDRNGTPVAVNRYFYRVEATPEQIETEAEREEVARQLYETIGLSYENTLSILTIYSDQLYAVLADAISLEDAQKIQALQAELETERGIFPLQNVYVKPMAKRFYPQAELACHLTGFVQVDLGGVTGIEEYYDQFLWADGIGLLDTQRTSLSSLPERVRRFVPSEVGKDLVLTLDNTIQWIIRDELQKGLVEFKAQSGTIIVMDPNTGAILGMVSLPDYDPNQFETSRYELFPNPALSAQYEPGSIFKIVTMAAALDADLITPTRIFTDTGSFTIGERVIFNSNRMAYGQVTVTDALARSLNVVTAQIADELGAEQFYRYIRLFGFGEATQVDLSGEIDGLIKTPRSPEWSRSDLGTNSFGQGLAVTPLQMINATAAIANGGRLMRPYIVQARIDGEEVQYTEPVITRQALSPETSKTLSDMMVKVIENGNTRAAVPGYSVAGKSGTAQIPSPEGYEENETIVSFVGFGPAEAPEFVILVKMDRPDPTVNQWASQTAAPVFSRVAKRLFDYMTIPPDDLRLAQAGSGGE